VEDAVLMQVNQRLQDLIKKPLGLLSRQWLAALGSHILLQVEFKVLKNKVKLFLTVDNFLKSIEVIRLPKHLKAANTYSTMLGCLIPLRREISRIAVEGTPSSSFSSLIFLSATNSPVTRSLHLYTTP